MGGASSFPSALGFGSTCHRVWMRRNESGKSKGETNTEELKCKEEEREVKAYLEGGDLRWGGGAQTESLA